jgi:hypothetical protein
MWKNRETAMYGFFASLAGTGAAAARMAKVAAIKCAKYIMDTGAEATSD